MAANNLSQDAPARFGTFELSMALLSNIAMGSNIVAMKVVVDALPPSLAVAVRMTVVFLLCLPWFRLVPGKNLALAAYGLLNGGICLLFINLSLHLAKNVGALAIVGQLGVPFSLVLGAVLFREHLTRQRAIGATLAFAGVVVLVFDPGIVREVPAVLLMIFATLCWAGGALVQRRLGGVPVLTIQAWNGLMGMALLAPIAPWASHGAVPRLELNATIIGWFAFSCIGSTMIGQGALAWLLQRHPISTVMPLMLLSPVVATTASSLYFHSPITPLMVVGGLVALGGVAIISFGGSNTPSAQTEVG